jgi:hypothetical protein
MIPMSGIRVSPPARQLASMTVRHPPSGRIVPGLGQLEQETDIVRMSISPLVQWNNDGLASASERPET